MAFQIVDDLFDYLGDPEVTGKPVGYDLAEGKVTLPLIAALREAGERDRRTLRQLALRKRWTRRAVGSSSSALIEQCGGFDYARDRAQQLADEARAHARRASPPGAPAHALDRAVDYAIARDH